MPSRCGRQRHHSGHHHQHIYSCTRRCCLRRPRRRYRQHIPVITITLPRRLSQNRVVIILRTNRVCGDCPLDFEPETEIINRTHFWLTSYNRVVALS